MAFHLSVLTFAAFLATRQKNYVFAGCSSAHFIHSCGTTTTSTPGYVHILFYFCNTYKTAQ